MQDKLDYGLDASRETNEAVASPLQEAV